MFSINYKGLKNLSVLFYSVFLFGFLSGCTVNPATGLKEFTPLLPASQEKQVGAEQHQNVVNEFGGLYKNKKLTAYVNQITHKIASVSELPADNFQVFILNSPEMNAFALPGGYVYLTRGLIAVANTEAELAGVIGHEIGHVTARHAANRSNTEVASGLGTVVVGLLTGSQQLAQVAQVGLQGIVASYSRSQEDQADMLGVRYLAKAGYSPYAQSDFLRSLRIYTDYEKAHKGHDDASMPSFFSTHPDTNGRVKKAYYYATQTNIKNGVIGRDTHLNAVQGILWGDDPTQGIVQGNAYIHPELKIAFNVPPEYRIINQPEAVYIQGSQGTIVRFDADFQVAGQPLPEYLQYQFAKGTSLSRIQGVSVNGLEGVTALTRINTNEGSKDARLFVFRMTPRRYYRFLMTAPRQIFAEKEADFAQIVQSFHAISTKDAKTIKPYYVAIKKIYTSDTLNNVAQNIPDFQNKIGLLRILNGLDTHEEIPKSGNLKTIDNK